MLYRHTHRPTHLCSHLTYNMEHLADGHNRDTQELFDRQSSSVTDTLLSVSVRERSTESSLEQDQSKKGYAEDHAKKDYLRVPSCAPPAYSASSSAAVRQPIQNAEDPLELLRQFDTVIILDDSISMSYSSYERHMPDGTLEMVTWWQEVCFP